ncbi:hypothetical protein C8R44DRAFT_819958 [Mycena epipterygia]|nr:hypothetical protein C8R44DRAFT_819958 [Mycena epipterygia]
MRSLKLFEILSILFSFREASAQATCGPSYNWMLNSYQQDPCEVAAYLGGVCDSGAGFSIAALIPGDYYTGPTVQQSNPCRCSSVFYSLLSACAICQSGECLSWSIYSHNCSIVYSGLFIGDIPPVTAVGTWAYQNVTKYDGFNVSLAQTLVTNATQSGSVSTSSEAPVSSVKIPNNPTPINASKSGNDNGHIALGVIGAICVVCIGVGLALTFKLWRKRRSSNIVTRSATYAHGYSPIVMADSQNTLLTTDRTANSASGGRQLRPNIVTPASSSLVSLPSLFYEPPEPSAYSPAVESSDMFTSQGGHSPLTERTVSLSHFVRLVPLRRPGGRS